MLKIKSYVGARILWKSPQKNTKRRNIGAVNIWTVTNLENGVLIKKKELAANWLEKTRIEINY